MRAFLKSFVYAFNGIITAIKTQRNFRFHIVAMIYVISFSFFYDLSEFEYMILVLLFILVISLELINTALENVVDLCSPEYNKYAEICKDCAAGAVLISAIGAVAIGVFIFADKLIIKNIFNYYMDNFMALFGLVTFSFISILFVNYPFDKMKGK